MLPKTGAFLEKDFEVMTMSSKTYRLDQTIVSGKTDGLEAVKQAVFCILNTERFDWLIFSWNYGIELKDLFGRTPGVVKSKLKKRIKEALMQDDRIVSIDAFSFTMAGRKMTASFQVRTKFGVIEAQKEVEI